MCCLLCYATAYGDGEVLLERIGGLVILGLFEWEEVVVGVVAIGSRLRNCLGKGGGSSRPDSPRGFHVRRASWKKAVGGGDCAALDV